VVNHDARVQEFRRQTRLRERAVSAMTPRDHREMLHMIAICWPDIFDRAAAGVASHERTELADQLIGMLREIGPGQ
jgi:hypothetical protein